MFHLHVGGGVIRTTGEHPFYVVGRGWTKVVDLLPGDLLLTQGGLTVAVEEVTDSGATETVYNGRIAEFHTYLVCWDEWAGSIWAHNANYDELLKEDETASKKERANAKFARNRQTGNAFRDALAEAKALDNATVIKELKIRPYLDNAQRETRGLYSRRGYRTLNGSQNTLELGLNEAKRTATAPFTVNQKPGYPLVERNGGVIENHAGGATLPIGTDIPPTEIRFYRLRDPLTGPGRSLQSEGLR